MWERPENPRSQIPIKFPANRWHQPTQQSGECAILKTRTAEAISAPTSLKGYKLPLLGAAKVQIHEPNKRFLLS